MPHLDVRWEKEKFSAVMTVMNEPSYFETWDVPKANEA
jgi:hypothetical protein